MHTTITILLHPRKDKACSYDPDGRTLQSYAYDIFGSQEQRQTRQSYDLAENPFQYAGEYRDPIWGGVYLRTRWYDPDLPLFVSRQIGWVGAEGYGLSSYIRNLSFTKRVLGRLAFDAALDVGQSVAVGADRGFSHFDKGAFWQNIELSVGTLGWDRLAGKGVNPYTLTGGDVARHISELGDSNTVLIFRERPGRYAPDLYTSPLQEWRNIGLYHARIVAVSKEFYASNELAHADRGVGNYSRVHSRLELDDYGVPVEDIVKKSHGRFQLVGTAQNFNRAEFLAMNPRGILSEVDGIRRAKEGNWTNVPKSARYSKIFNNRQDHAAAVLQQLEIQ